MVRVEWRHARGSHLAAALGAGLLVLAAAGAAHAADGSVFPNYTFPDGTRGFHLEATNGFVEPCIFVGFGPVSSLHDLPITTLNLGQPPDPVFTNPFAGQQFRLEWSLADFGDGSVAPPPAPNSDGVTSFRHVIQGHTFETTFTFGPGLVDAGSWVGFNPQPDPPGFAFGVDFQFMERADPFVSFEVHEDGVLLNWALDNDGVPEPATWSLLIAGFGLAGAGLRRRRGAQAAA